MKTLSKLALLTALAAVTLAVSVTESQAQSFVTRYAVKVKHPLRSNWMPYGLYSTRFQAERRAEQVGREWWVIYHRDNGPKRFRSARSHSEAVELMLRLKYDGYCVFKKRKFARVSRARKRIVYTVRDYNPLTGRVRSTRTFNNYSQARSYYNQLRNQYWVIVKPRTGRTKYVLGGTKAQADLKAVALSLPFGQRAYAKRRSVRISTRTI